MLHRNYKHSEKLGLSDDYVEEENKCKLEKLMLHDLHYEINKKESSNKWKSKATKKFDLNMKIKKEKSMSRLKLTFLTTFYLTIMVCFSCHIIDIDNIKQIQKD